MTSTDTTKVEYTDKTDLLKVIRSDVEVNKKFIENTGEPTKIVYYCGDCKKMITPKRVGKKLQFSCGECKGNNVAFGSEESIA
ncbi:hypothetical protein KKA95_02945, partial [Patescibacteria group bacterium]|nr:hypothetical protein [Patescibacteria group bacterium]